MKKDFCSIISIEKENFQDEILKRIDGFYRVIDGKDSSYSFMSHTSTDLINPIILEILKSIGISTTDLSFEYMKTIEYKVLVSIFVIAEYFDEFKGCFRDNPDSSVDRCKKILMKYSGFITSYASVKYHGNYKMGLLIHSMNVLGNAIKMAPIYRVDFEDFDMIPVLFHDLCKVGRYILEKDSDDLVVAHYNNEMPSIEHGAESLRRLLNLNISISESWQLAVAYHMGVYNASQSETANFSKMASKYPEVLLLHHADALSAAVYE